MRYMNKRRVKKQTDDMPFGSYMLSQDFIPYMLSLFEEGKDPVELTHIMAERIVHDNIELTKEIVEVFLFEIFVEAMEDLYLE